MHPLLHSLQKFFPPHRKAFLVGFAALCINCAQWLYLSRTLVPQDVDTPLHYNIYFGIDLLGPWWYLFLLPAIGFAVLLVNGTLTVIFFRRDRLAPAFLLGTAVLVQVLLFLTAVTIIHQVS